MGANLATYRHTGVFVQFADWFPAASDAMRKAHLFEATNQIARAKNPAQNTQAELRRSSHGMAAYEAGIGHEIIERLNWSRETTLQGRYLGRAERALGYRYYFTATIMSFESIRTTVLRFLYPDGEIAAYHPDREPRIDGWIDENCSEDELRVYHNLRRVRNCIAHGTRPSGRNSAEITEILEDAANLERLLRDGLELARNLAEDLRRRDAETK